MTELLVILGLGALVAGLVFRNRVKPFLRWSVSSILFGATLVPLFVLLCITVALALAAVALIIGIVAMFCVVVLLVFCLIVLYALSALVTLVIWAVSRKRTAFDWLNRLFGSMADGLYDVVENAFDRLDQIDLALDWAIDRLEPLFAFSGKHGLVFAQPFIWLARKIWPNNR